MVTTISASGEILNEKKKSIKIKYLKLFCNPLNGITLIFSPRSFLNTI